MNCPQCQERLDEQLDELRPGLRSGTLSPDDARTQAQQALAEAVSQCAHCEGELRAHLNLRLSLMIPDEEMASVAVPPTLRANVRRALEREAAPRPYTTASPSWNPLKGFVWTGGAVLSAIALFVIARPFLYEQAQTPLPDTAISVSSAPADGTASNSGAADSVTPPVVKQGNPIKPSTPARRTPSPQKPTPPTALGRTKPQTSSGAQMPRVLPTPRSEPSQPIEPPRPISSGAPSPKVAPAPSGVVQSPPQALHNARPNAPQASSAPSPLLSKPQAQTMRSSQPTSKKPSVEATDSGKGTLREPRLENNALAPAGKELGLVVRFVPVASERSDGVKNARSMYAAPAPSTLMAPPAAPPAPVAPPPASMKTIPSPAKAVPDQSPQPAPPGIAPQRAMRSRVAPDTTPETMAGSASNVESTTMADRAATEKGSLSVSVNEAVANARVTGQIKGREGQTILLWSGNASARKSISVPLGPLNASKGDTINIAFEQQVSSNETKTLGTASIVIP